MESTKNTSNLEEFCKDALSLLGAAVSEAAPGVWEVALPPSLLDIFDGRPSLQLAFYPELADEGIDLVAPGSYVLEKLLAAVRPHGSLAQLRLRPVVQVSPTPQVELLNAQVRLISSQSVYHALLAVNFKVSFITDEDQEKLYSVVVDLATGNLLNRPSSSLMSLPTDNSPTETEEADLDLSKGFDCARIAAERFAREWADSMQESIDKRLAEEIRRLDTYYKDMHTDAAASSRNRDIRKLQEHRDQVASEYSELERTFEIAREFLEAAGTQEELKSLLKLKQQPIEQEIRRAKLKAVAVWSYYDEINRLKYNLKLVDKAAEIAIDLINRFHPETRQTELKKSKQQALDDLKKRSEEKESAKFNAESADYLQNVSTQLEAEKARRIAELQDKFQIKAVISPLSASLIRYPRMECRFAAVSGAVSIPFTTYHDLVTGKAEPPVCQVCDGAMSSAYACLCGHLACPACHRECAGCGKHLCASCVEVACQVCGGVLCEGCRSACALCQKAICPSHTAQCKTCRIVVCKAESGTACSKVCSLCGEAACPDHAQVCPICKSSVCLVEMRECLECGIRACRSDVGDCPSCGKAVCSQHSQACAFCRQPVCKGCAGLSGYCKTCADLFPAAASIPAIKHIVSELGNIRFIGKGHWFIGENGCQFILASVAGRVRIWVVDKSPCRLRSQHHLGMLDSLREKIRLARLSH